MVINGLIKKKNICRLTDQHRAVSLSVICQIFTILTIFCINCVQIHFLESWHNTYISITIQIYIYHERRFHYLPLQYTQPHLSLNNNQNQTTGAFSLAVSLYLFTMTNTLVTQKQMTTICMKDLSACDVHWWMC